MIVKRATGAVLVSAALLASACAAPAGTGVGPTASGNATASGPLESYKIGLLPTISGTAALNGQRMQWGAELAAEEINNAGGVNGHKIELRLEDTQLNPTVAVGLMNKLVSVEGVKAFIGQASPVMLALSPIAAQNKVVIINHSAVNPTIANAEGYVFTNIADAATESEAIVPYAINTLKIKTAATLTGADDIGRGAANAFKAAFEAKGGKIVDTELYDPAASTDLRAQLLKIRDAKPDAIYSTNTPNGLKQADQIGLKAQWLSNEFFESADNLNLAGALANGVVYTFIKFDPQANSRSAMFLTDYQKKYAGAAGVDQVPHIYAVTAYDAVYMYAEAFGKVGYDGTKVRDYIRTLKDWQGAAGTVNFNAKGAVIMPVVLKKVENLKFVTIP
jgi:branched-chain amino acid transport system substrate-binding protein